jgi:serine/threonine protein kinase
MLKLQQFVTTPVAVYINENNTIHVISTVRQSLYELLHVTKTVVPTFIKLQILVLLAKIVNTLHCLKHRCWAHGNLTSHNVFVEIQGTEVRVQVDGFEYADLKKYANKFYCYRPISVWSPPEVMKAPKKYFDPESTMDVYSFGVMMWELFHEQVPFDGNTTAATKLVLDNTRPMIIEEGEETPCTEPMANLIRKCWTSEPAERPTFNFVIEQLLKELSFFQNKDESSSSDE